MRLLPYPILLLALFAGACSKPLPAPDAPGEQAHAAPVKPPPAPVLIHLPGIGGELGVDRRLTRGLVAGGVAPSSRIVDWTGPNRGLMALGALNYNKQQARALASQIEQIYRADPRTRIVLTSHSGGTGIAVWALEMLPPDVKIDTLVLLAAALSPEYDLSKALTHAKRAFSLHSQYDADVLGTGTRLFGTIDRVRTDAAGYVGFRTERASDASQYAKLTQLPYDASWMQLGNFGDHIGAMDEQFARDYLAKLILAP